MTLLSYIRLNQLLPVSFLLYYYSYIFIKPSDSLWETFVETTKLGGPYVLVQNVGLFILMTRVLFLLKQKEELSSGKTFLKMYKGSVFALLALSVGSLLVLWIKPESLSFVSPPSIQGIYTSIWFVAVYLGSLVLLLNVFFVSRIQSSLKSDGIFWAQFKWVLLFYIIAGYVMISRGEFMGVSVPHIFLSM